MKKIGGTIRKSLFSAWVTNQYPNSTKISPLPLGIISRAWNFVYKKSHFGYLLFFCKGGALLMQPRRWWRKFFACSGTKSVLFNFWSKTTVNSSKKKTKQCAITNKFWQLVLSNFVFWQIAFFFIDITILVSWLLLFFPERFVIFFNALLLEDNFFTVQKEKVFPGNLWKLLLHFFYREK